MSDNKTIKKIWTYDHAAAKQGHYGGKAPRRSRKKVIKDEYFEGIDWRVN